MENLGSVLKFLQEAILIDKNKRIIDLSETNLSGAIVTPEQLDKAHSLKDTILQDGSKHP